MKKMKVDYRGQSLYDSLYYLQHGVGIRGHVYSYFYDSKGRLKERNYLGDFLITTECAVHFNFAYQFNARIPYTLAFDLLKQSLIKAAAKESVLDLDSTLHEELIMYLGLTYPENFTTEELQLSNMDNLSYLFEHMMRYNCSPAVTNDFLSKLILIDPVESENEFEKSALLICNEIEGIITDDKYTETVKRDALELAVAKNMDIFNDYENSLKEWLYGYTISRWSKDLRIYG